MELFLFPPVINQLVSINGPKFIAPIQTRFFFGTHGVHGGRHFNHRSAKKRMGEGGSAQRQVTVEQNGIAVDSRGEKA